MIFNTHSHINDKLDNLDELVEECLEKGVNKIAVVGYDYNQQVLMALMGILQNLRNCF